MDLFAYIARRVLKEMNGNYDLFKDENLNEIPKDTFITVY
jgi:hypothetical protein